MSRFLSRCILFLLCILLLAGCSGKGSVVNTPVKTGLARLEGRIVDNATGAPVAGASVALYSSSVISTVAMRLSGNFPGKQKETESPGIMRAISKNDGRFEIAGVEPGDYILVAAKENMLAGQKSVKLLADDVVVVDISLWPLGSISGRVIVPGQYPTVPFIWIEGTSYGAAGKLVSATASSSVYEYIISGVPVNPSSPYTLRAMMPGTSLIDVTVRVTVSLSNREVSAPELSFLSPEEEPEPAGNNPPYFTTLPGTVTVRPGQTATLTAGAVDPDNDPVTYNWTQTGGPPVVVSGAETATITFTPAEKGVYTFLVIAKDAYGVSDPVSGTVVAAVPGENIPPIAEPGGPQFVTVNTTVTLDGSQSMDIDGTVTGWTWTYKSGPVTALTISNRNSAVATFIPPVDGKYVIGLVVRDDKGANSPERTVLIEVHPGTVQASGVTFTDNPPGTEDRLIGGRGAAPPNSVIGVFGDPQLLDFVSSGQAASDGSFSINAGDNAGKIKPDSTYKWLYISVRNSAWVYGPGVEIRGAFVGTAPAPPPVANLAFSNKSREVRVISGSVGSQGDVLAVYFNGVPGGKSEPAPAGGFTPDLGAIITVMIPADLSGATIQYSLISPLGRESSKVTDGTVPLPVPPGDVGRLSMVPNGKLNSHFLKLSDGPAPGWNNGRGKVYAWAGEQHRTGVFITIPTAAVSPPGIISGSAEIMLEREVGYTIVDPEGNESTITWDGLIPDQWMINTYNIFMLADHLKVKISGNGVTGQSNHAIKSYIYNPSTNSLTASFYTFPGNATGERTVYSAAVPDGCEIYYSVIDTASGHESLLVQDGVIPVPPVNNMNQYRVNNLTREIKYTGVSDGNDRVALRVIHVSTSPPENPVPVGLFDILNTGPYTEGMTVYSDISPVPAGRRVKFCFVDVNGENESTYVNGAIVPPKPNTTDLQLLFIAPSTTRWQVMATGNLSLANGILLVGPCGPENVVPAGSIAGGVLMPFTDSIDGLERGYRPVYAYKSPEGYISEPSAEDGVIAGLAYISEGPSTAPGLSNGDRFVLAFEAGPGMPVSVTVPVPVSNNDVAAGTFFSGELRWPAVLKDINITTEGMSMSDIMATGTFTFVNTGTASSHFITIPLYGGPYNDVTRIYIDFPETGTMKFRSPGGHVVLPCQIISANGDAYGGCSSTVTP